MPVTKEQNRRIEILDELLGVKRWSLRELLDRVNQTLATTTIDKRTLYRDLNFLENEKGAPLHRPEKGDHLYYYREKFSLKSIGIGHEDVAILRRAVDMLRECEHNQMVPEVEMVIMKLENRVRG